MILAELVLENYKQYEGHHAVTFPQHGIVAVIGANGVGKTTLFEAIEWCLYNPREIANAEVPPRGGVGQTVVRVVLEDAAESVRYVVERRLKRGVTNAEIYREDQPEAPLVQGTRQVTDYVARRLIGLGHRAFVSTFFTRQKELSFFGELKETDRRREVGRLLGLETIREAQRLIGEDRQLARAEASSLKRQYDEESAGRDFPDELAVIETALTTAEATAASAAEAQAAATAAHLATRTDLDRWRKLEQADHGLRRELAQLAGDLRAAAARRDAETATLRRLSEAEETRARLVPLAAAEPQRRAVVAGYVADRERWERRRSTERDVARAAQAATGAVREMERAVRAVGPAAERVPGWFWGAGAQDDALAEADRLLALAATLNRAAAEERARALDRCHALLDAREIARKRFDSQRRLLDDLEREHASLLATGDPAATAAAAQQAREAAVDAAGAARTKADGASAQIATLTKIARALKQAASAADRCPTCQRPFQEDETESVLVGLHQAIADERAREAALRQEQRAAEAAAAEAEKTRLAAQERLQQLVTLDARITQGTPMVAAAGTEFDHLVTQCVAEMERLDLAREPTPAQTAAANAYAALLAEIDKARTLLVRLTADARRADSEHQAAANTLAAIGPVTYDPAAHAAAERDLEQSVSVSAQIAQIGEQLARRPEHEAALAAAEAEAARLTMQQAAVEAQRTALGFDPAALAVAVAAEEAALAAVTAAATTLRDAEEAIREVRRQRESLLREQARLADLATRAEAKRREADELDRMYREFSRFDQYVAAKVTPQLAEQTGELLAAVTDNKYDRVAFDENYGLHIFDADESFAMAEFSGGERDVAALCARLALSRLIGSQATRPPRFLVLDEVFGSLDPERRSQLLGTLGSLAASTDLFQQLFIISHVEDVRVSPVVDDVWRITEVDGVSHWQSATNVGTVEDL